MDDVKEADLGNPRVSGAMDVPTDEPHPAKRGNSYASQIFSNEKMHEKHAGRHKTDKLRAPITNCGPSLGILDQ